MPLPKPYYDRDGITIYHGDCKDILPELPKVDLVLTDPPYGIGLGTIGRAIKMQKHGNTGYTQVIDNEDFIISIAVPIIQSCIECCNRVVVTPGERCMFLYPRPYTTMALYWPNGAGRQRWATWGCWQPVLCYGSCPSRKGAVPNVIRTTSQAQKNGHPCPKPLDVWMKLLFMVQDDDTNTVLDPFMGSGATLRAAKDLGRKSIGIELEEKYCEIAANRLRQEVLAFGQE